MRMLLIPAVSLCLQAQTPEAFDRIRARMAEHLAHQPNYTCLETVERTHQDRGGGVQDTVRLEVALVDGNEIFAWPGSKKFEDRGVHQLITTGMFGNGNFALFAHIVFDTNLPDFEFRGDATIDGQRVVRYDFRVPRQRSQYRMRIDLREDLVGFHGSFYADRDSGEIRRLEVSADDIPPRLSVISSDDRIDYGRVRIGDEDFLLPVASELNMKLAVEEDRNSVRFSACRRFIGTSEVSYTAPTDANLPTNTILELELRDDLDLSKGAVGDPVQAVLRQAVAGVPKGAVAAGRIVKLDRRDGFFRLRIDFQDLDWPGAHANLKATLTNVGPVSSADAGQPGAASVQADDGGEIVIVRPGPSPLKGIVMFWRTDQ
jgi:hypothetical protein